MSRLIDATKLIKKWFGEAWVMEQKGIEYCDTSWEDVYDHFIADLDSMPTVDSVPLEDYKSMERTVNKLTKAFADAVEVVRCKNCRYWDAFPTASSTPYIHECSCRHPHRGTSGDDFCSWGERREDGEID